MALSRVVSEIFNVEQCRDLEIGVRGHSSTVSEINGDVRRKSNENRQFSHPRVFNAPDEGVTLGIWYRHKGF